jgi:hypothetical protein
MSSRAATRRDRGPTYIVRRSTTASISGWPARAFRDLLPVFGLRAGADQQVSEVPSEHDGDIDEHQPDDDRGRRIPDPLAGCLTEPDPERSHDHAGDGHRVLVENRLDRRLGADADVLSEAEAALRCLSPRLADRADERDPFRDEGEGERRVRDRVAPFIDGADELDNAVADREHGARDEDEHGGERGPKEARLAVPKRMLLVRLLLAERQRGQEKGLVRSVGHGVGGLRQHRRRALNAPATPFAIAIEAFAAKATSTVFRSALTNDTSPPGRGLNPRHKIVRC